MSTRVYVPSTLRRLRAIVDADGVGPAPFRAHAVTDAVRAALPDAGDEEWEYAAASAAAQSAVTTLDADEPARRVVLAIDVPAARPVGGDDATLVEVDEEVPLRRISAVLADSRDAETTVAAARAALARGSADGVRRMERCLDHQLGWWAAQEIDVLLSENDRR